MFLSDLSSLVVEFYNTSDAKVQAAIITGIASMISAGMTAFTAIILGKWITNRQKIIRDLKTAMNDIEFLLKVEENHCQRNKEQFNQSYKNTTRANVKESNLEWSGKFTKSQIQTKIKKL